MKVLYVVTSADQGGAQHYTLTLAQHFKGTIAFGTEHDWLFKQARKEQIPTIELKHLRRAINPYHDLLAFFELRRLIKKERPDLLHVSSSKAGVLASLAARGSNIPVVYTVHGFVLQEELRAYKRALYGFMERLGAKHRAHTIAVSKADYGALLAAGVVRREACSVVYNGIGAIDFLGRGISRKELGLPAEGLIVGTIANLYENKGIDILIQAIAQLRPEAQRSITAVAIIGEGPERARLERLIATHELADKIHLLGSRNGGQLLKAFDIFVLPSRKEGMPFALLEALQAGLPIIATDVGGIRETVDAAAILIKPEQPIQLARELEQFVSDEKLRNRLSIAAKDRAAVFSELQMVESTAAVYKKILDAKVSDL
jgi:glycosyltransferase involved in cell wall biosynthesis